MDYSYEHEFALEKTAFHPLITSTKWLPERRAFVTWALQLYQEQMIYPESIFLGIYLFDNFTQTNPECSLQVYQVAIATSLWISTKFHESEFNENPNLNIQHLVVKCNKRYNHTMFYQMERFILQSCNWKLHIPTSHSFLCYYFKEMKIKLKVFPFTQKHIQFCYDSIQYFSIIHYDQMNLWYPSEIAAATLGLLFYYDPYFQLQSNYLFYIYWFELFSFHEITTYSYHMIHPCIEQMNSILKNNE
jgi:hypothetical protein